MKYIRNEINYIVEFWWCEGLLHKHRTERAAARCEAQERVYVGTKGIGGYWFNRTGRTVES